MTKKKDPKDLQKRGRKTLYKPEYCQMIVDYFSKPPYRVETVTIYPKKGEAYDIEKDVANDPPFLAGFAHSIGCARFNLWEWDKRYPEFSKALKKAKELQEDFIATNMVRGLYSNAGAIFTLKNVAGWKDYQDLRGSTAEKGKQSFIEFLLNGPRKENPKQTSQIPARPITAI